MASDHVLLGAAVNVADLDRAADFYTRVFGLKEINRYETEDMSEVFLKWQDGDGETAVVLVMRTNPEAPSEDRQAYGRMIIRVPDVRATVALVREAGGEAGEAQDIVVESIGVDMTVAMAKDPDGYMIELVEDHNA